MGATVVRSLVGLTLVFLGACAGDKVVIGAQLRGGQGSDGGTDARGTVGCNGNATPSASPAGGYLTLDVKGTKRQYALELPTGYDGVSPVPVLLAFNGSSSGIDAQTFLGPDYGNVRAGAAGRVLLVGPNAQSWMGSSAWVDFSGDQGNGVTQADVDFFDALVSQLKANYCVDADRIFAMGHGDGAIIANQLACLRGNVLRGVAPFAGAGPDESQGATCTGKVAAFIGHDPNEGDPAQCGRVTGGSCPWSFLWADTGWPTTQYWTKQNGCPGTAAMPTVAFAGDGTTGSPLPCQPMSGCSRSYPVSLCLYDYWNQEDGPHAFPVQWGARAATDFFLSLPKIQ
jgi:poly(3-hydroxybutyrate) depolymerase